MFVCTKCFKTYKYFKYICDCGGALLFELEKPTWKPKGEGVWRYQSLLPVKKNVSLDEGNTPLIKRRDVPGKVFMKLEGDNPTGSFKDRGTTVVLSHASAKHYKTVGVASTGNMGASVSAYAAYANLEAKVFVPTGTSVEKIAQIIAHNAKLIRVKGTFHDCVDRLWKDVRRGTYLAMTGLNPYYLEGEKTIAFEIFEEIGVPDKIIVPMGTGGILTAIFKGFKELKSMEKIKELPEMIGVQARNCSPIVDAWEKGTEKIKELKKAKTIASAILIKTPFNGHTAIRAINESGGKAVKVTETQIIKAIKKLGEEGVFAEPASATTLAALGKINYKKNEKIVLIITGHGLKQPEAIIS